MSRQQPPPDPAEGSAAAFAYQLYKLRLDAGNPSFREMAAEVHISHTSLSRATQGKTFPTWETTKAFLVACGEDPDSWQTRWEVARIEFTQEKRRRKEPPQDGHPPDQAPMLFGTSPPTAAPTQLAAPSTPNATVAVVDEPTVVDRRPTRVRVELVTPDGHQRRVVGTSERPRGAHRRTLIHVGQQRERDTQRQWGDWAGTALAIIVAVMLACSVTTLWI